MADPVAVAKVGARIRHQPLSLRSADLGGAELAGEFLGDADLRAANLAGADLTDADLTGANLDGADLANCRLDGAKLRRARLLGATLDGCSMRSASLYRAVLDGLNLANSGLDGARFDRSYLRATIFDRTALSRAEFIHCDLSRASFADSDLRDVNFEGSQMAQVNMSEARLRRCDMTGVNLTGATFDDALISRCRLEGATVAAARMSMTILADVSLAAVPTLPLLATRPSSTTLDTIARTVYDGADNVLLRGLGLSDTMISYLRSVLHAESGMGFAFLSTFISYSHADALSVDRIQAAFDDAGVPYFRDVHQIFPGDNLHRSVDRGISRSERVIVCCSETSLSIETGWWLDREVTQALELEQRRAAEGDVTPVLIPVDLDGFLFSDKCSSHHGPMLRSRLACRLTSRRDMRAELDRLIAALNVDGPPRKFPGVF